jgi:hypothetical protein
MTDRKYCEDCKFCDTTSGMSLARCGNSKAPETNIGDRFVARQFDKPKFASSVRLEGALCGPDAAWFEPKASEQVAA